MSDVIDALTYLGRVTIFFVTISVLVVTGIFLQTRFSSTSVTTDVTWVGERCTLACDGSDSLSVKPYDCGAAGPYPELVKGGFCRVVPGRYFAASFDEVTSVMKMESRAEQNFQVGDQTKLLMSDSGSLWRNSPLKIPLLILASIAALSLLRRVSE